MKRILNIVYTLITILIITGAIFTLQEKSYGVLIITIGLLLNVFYRIFILNFDKIKKIQWFEVLRGVNILFMLVALTGVYLDWNEKINLLILVIIFDLILNFKEISAKNTIS